MSTTSTTRSISHPWPMACGALALAASSAAAATVNLIADTEMAPASFTAYTFISSGEFSFETGQALAGGNPGAYRTISHSSVSGVAGGAVIHRHITTWNPSTDGAIDTIDMGIDVNCFNGGTSEAVGFGLILEQNGIVYFGPEFTAFTGSGWRIDLRQTGLLACGFTFEFNCPDFSETGSEIAFGFYSSNGTGSGIPIASTSGVDNLTVTLHLLAPTCPGDINGDGKTSVADFNILAAHFAQSVTPGTNGDLTGNGFVNISDFNILAGDFACGF